MPKKTLKTQSTWRQLNLESKIFGNLVVVTYNAAAYKVWGGIEAPLSDETPVIAEVYSESGEEIGWFPAQDANDFENYLMAVYA